MLRHELGDSVFWQSIRNYYTAFAGANADTDDLMKIFEKTSGKKLETFFRQWLYTPGQPKLNISWKTDTSKKLFITVTQQQLTPFLFPIEVKIITQSGKSKVERLNITKKEQTFILNSTETVTALVADPDINLLCEQKTMKTD